MRLEFCSWLKPELGLSVGPGLELRLWLEREPSFVAVSVAWARTGAYRFGAVFVAMAGAKLILWTTAEKKIVLGLRSYSVSRD